LAAAAGWTCDGEGRSVRPLAAVHHGWRWHGGTSAHGEKQLVCKAKAAGSFIAKGAKATLNGMVGVIKQRCDRKASVMSLDSAAACSASFSALALFKHRAISLLHLHGREKAVRSLVLDG